jgi:hypothetical protein
MSAVVFLLYSVERKQSLLVKEPPMLNTIGLVARKHRTLWLDMLRHCKPRRIVEVPFGDEVPHAPVEAWLVVPDTLANLIAYSFWLRSLQAPIVLITPQTGAARQLARTVPALAIICHPLPAEDRLADLLFLAGQRTGGVRVIDAPRERHVVRLHGPPHPSRP